MKTQRSRGAESAVPKSFQRFALLTAATLAASCWTAPQPEFEEASPALPHMTSGSSSTEPTGPVNALPGVSTDALNDQQKHVWWKVVSQLYSPCTDQAIGLVQCVQEARPCAACTPMAQFIADRVKNGATGVDSEAAAALRFGPDVKKIEVRNSPTLGPSDAPVTIVVWSDFECPHCKMAIPILEKFQHDHGDKVRLVHKFYPLIHKHAKAKGAAVAAVAAQKQGKYWEMERLLFENQDALDPSDLERYAKKLGLDTGKFNDDMAAPASESIIDKDMSDADEAGLHATPFVLINGRHFDQDYFKYPELEAWLALELQLIAKKPGANP